MAALTMLQRLDFYFDFYRDITYMPTNSQRNVKLFLYYADIVLDGEYDAEYTNEVLINVNKQRLQCMK